MNAIRRSAIVLGAAALAAASLTFAPSATAAESPTHGCAYPRVCFYLTMSDWNAKDPNAGFQDVTSSWQNLGSASRGADMVLNTRNDDVAHLRVQTNSTGAVWNMCLPPNSAHQFGSAYTVTGIRISTSSSC
ncbi:hypothetical protein [Streptomyces mesophilus]|uniref:hypothetical protein n=1 Tax=Streptomyces mesophilus TaxID=1775132 RepID=UPI003319A3EA